MPHEDRLSPEEIARLEADAKEGCRDCANDEAVLRLLAELRALRQERDEARRNLEHQALATEKGRELVGPWIKEVEQLKRERDELKLQLAEALRRILADDPMDGGKYSDARAALAAYDAERPVREAERDLLDYVLCHEINDWPELETLKCDLLAAREAREAKS